MKLCAFPNDPIIAYYNKGEIKERYFNPKNFFDEIHIISLTDNDIDESKVKTLAGNAKLKIHSIGKINIKNHSKNLNKVISLVKEISPNIIRAYNPLIEGWLAAKCSEELHVPLFLSLHIQYDGLRNLYRKINFKRYLALKYSEKIIEPYVVKKADKITIVYRIIEPYVVKNGGIKPEVLYNRIDYNRFATGIQVDSLPKPLVITVGRLTKQKNHDILIEAMTKVNANLLIIGDGELYNDLLHNIQKKNLQQRVKIIKSVPNSEIQNYYKSANVFALAYDSKLEGLPIPIMEAMASGLPVVIPFPREGLSDGLENTALFCNNDSNSFAQKINEILNNSNLKNEYSVRSTNKAKEFDNSIIEKREAEIYSELLTIP